MALSQITDLIVMEEAKSTLAKALAPLKKFTHNFSGEYAKSVTFKKITDGGTFSSNPTSYTATSSTGSPVTCNLTEYNLSFGVTTADKKNGYKLADLIETNIKKFANGIHAEIMNNLSTASVEAIGASTAFSKSKLKSLSVKVGGDNVTCGLTPDYFVQIIPEEAYNLNVAEKGIYGFDGGVDMVKAAVLPTGVVGYISNSDGIAVATALPQIDDKIKDVLHTEVIELPDLAGMSVLVCSWVDVATRMEQMSFGIMLGSVIIDTDAVKALKVSA